MRGRAKITSAFAPERVAKVFPFRNNSGSGTRKSFLLIVNAPHLIGLVLFDLPYRPLRKWTYSKGPMTQQENYSGEKFSSLPIFYARNNHYVLSMAIPTECRPVSVGAVFGVCVWLFIVLNKVRGSRGQLGKEKGHWGETCSEKRYAHAWVICLMPILKLTEVRAG